MKTNKITDHLITMKPFDLVELSHDWYSWQVTYNRAKKLGKNSEKIDLELIKIEQKIYKRMQF
jgi:hypothetical protein